MSDRPVVIPGLRLLEALVRILARLHPTEFRDAHGAEVTEFVRDRYRETFSARGRVPALLAALRTLWSLTVSLVMAHWEEHRFGLSHLRPGHDALFQDLRQAVRRLSRQPGFTAVVVLTLAIGIGANTAIFSIVNTVLLEPLPYPNPDQLVIVRPYPWIPTEAVLDWRESGTGFQEVAAFYPRQFAVTRLERPEEIEGARVTANFFTVLGASTRLGRQFLPEDERPGSPRTAMISHGVWQRRYGSDPNVIGKTIDVNGESREIIGVMGKTFRVFGPRTTRPQLWIPLELDPIREDGALNYVIPLARLSRGVSVRHGQMELDRISNRLNEQHPRAQGRGWDFKLGSLKSDLIQNVRLGLVLLQVAVGFVLLIACANVANLLLARFVSVQQEMAVRGALGASRMRLARQVLTESVVLSGLGGVVGLLLTVWGLALILVLAPADIPRLDLVSINLPVLMFTLIVSILTGLIFGLAPVLVPTKQNLHEFLKEGGRTTVGARRRHRVSSLLVISEVALALGLMVSAGLLINSFYRLSQVDPGFATDKVLTAHLRIPPNKYENVDKLNRFYQQVLERLDQRPAIEFAALSNNFPLSRSRSSREFVVENNGDTLIASYGVISSNYFRALAIPVLRGRSFDDRDMPGSVKVAVIDESLWRLGWPDQDPIGKRFSLEEGEDNWISIVGVVADTRGNGLQSPSRPGFYIPYLQRPDTYVELAVGRNAVLLGRTVGDAEQSIVALRGAVWDVAKEQPVDRIAVLSNVLSDQVKPQRFRTFLLSIFSAIAVLLALAGIYGVIEFVMTERTHEFGVRMALGATPGNILRMVMQWGLKLAAVGIVLGVIGAFAVTRYLASLLFGIAPTDPATVIGAVLLLALVACLACYIPAHRATRVNPLVALRTDRAYLGAGK